MKAVLISIQPKWCELIASGKKTIEVRKTKPKIDVPFKCYIYETKDKHFENIGVHYADGSKDFINHIGKVIGEFVCDRIQEITYTQIYNFGRYRDVCEAETRLDFYALDDYLKQKNGYGWHITDLVIYDKPKLLRWFQKPCICKSEYDGEEYQDCLNCDLAGDSDYGIIACNRPITRPPQSWCYVEELR